MAPRSFLLTDDLDAYVRAHTVAFDEVLERLTQRTAALGDVAGMQIGPDQAAFLTMLTRFAGVRSAVEVGTFTGTSALCVARGLAPGGRLLCCDVSEEWTSIARDAWAEAGVDDRIELRIGPGAETLAALPDDEAIDLAFVDADKTGYLAYYEELVPRLRPGGWLVADNTLWSGQVVDADDTSESTEALRAYNDRAASDERVETVVLALADGLTVSQRR
ncbi:MAG: class I SAM-dependent methyltransferase [Acidimicrobiales bacterium]|nr:class I SAM-dependent methyltransferase [Acidimicrobiales bacterium]